MVYGRMPNSKPIPSKSCLVKFPKVFMKGFVIVVLYNFDIVYYLPLYELVRGMFLCKYRFEIPLLQRCGQCRAHVHCIPTSVDKRQPLLRQHLSMFTFVFTYLKYLHSSKIPPTVKYAL